VSEAFQNFDHADAGARIQRVHKTRDEKRDGHSMSPLFMPQTDVSSKKLTALVKQF